MLRKGVYKGRVYPVGGGGDGVHPVGGGVHPMGAVCEKYLLLQVSMNQCILNFHNLWAEQLRGKAATIIFQP